MKKFLLLFTVCFFMGIISHRIYRYYYIHRCDNPYHEVCIKSHIEITFIYLPHQIGETITIWPLPVTNTICDEYVKEIKKECTKEE